MASPAASHADAVNSEENDGMADELYQKGDKVRREVLDGRELE